jgi:glycosyltransferase involved in cell wall biosynthesis
VCDINVAVWMITYNHSLYVGEAIESVLRQKCNFRVHIFIGVDLCSDNTLEICLDYQNRFPERITVLPTHEKLGPSRNAIRVYNACIESGADYMALLEGDDYWTDEHKLEKQIEVLDNDKLISVVCSSYWMEKDGKKIITALNDNDEKESYIFKNIENMSVWFTKTCTSVIRVSSLPYSCVSKYKCVFDYHVMYEALRNGNGVYLKYPTAFYRIHTGGIWSQRPVTEKTRMTYLIYRQLADFHPDDHFVIEQYKRKLRDYLKSFSETGYTITMDAVIAPIHFFLLTRRFVQALRLYKHLIE